MVEAGWGASLLLAATQHEVSTANGCNFAMSEATAREWEAWDLAPPGMRLQQASWDRMWLNASYLNRIFEVKLIGSMQFSPMPHAGGNPGQWWNTPCGESFRSTVLKMFRPRQRVYAQPYAAPYAGLHVRHGDKVLESQIFPFETFMDELRVNFSSIHRTFVATDDSGVLKGSMLDTYRQDGFEFNWTRYHRRAGGEPQKEPNKYKQYSHEHNAAIVSAVLDDTMGLGNASVLVGNWKSNFFRVGWLLNVARQTS